MNHPAPVNPTTLPLPAKPQLSLSPARRSEINRDLDLPGVGLAVAVNHPPGNRRPHLRVVKLPRGSSGRPPRRGVHIPLPTFGAVRLARAGKHARQQPRDGKFGRKGYHTILRKLDFLEKTSVEANHIASQRRDERIARLVEETVLTLKPGQWVQVIGRKVYVVESIDLEARQ